MLIPCLFGWTVLLSQRSRKCTILSRYSPCSFSERLRFPCFNIFSLTSAIRLRHSPSSDDTFLKNLYFLSILPPMISSTAFFVLLSFVFRAFLISSFRVYAIIKLFLSFAALNGLIPASSRSCLDIILGVCCLEWINTSL